MQMRKRRKGKEKKKLKIGPSLRRVFPFALVKCGKERYLRHKEGKKEVTPTRHNRWLVLGKHCFPFHICGKEKIGENFMLSLFSSDLKEAR